LVLINNVSLIDLTILTILGDLGYSAAYVFGRKQSEHFTGAPVDENARSIYNYLLECIAGPRAVQW